MTSDSSSTVSTTAAAAQPKWSQTQTTVLVLFTIAAFGAIVWATFDHGPVSKPIIFLVGVICAIVMLRLNRRRLADKAVERGDRAANHPPVMVGEIVILLVVVIFVLWRFSTVFHR